MKLKKASFSIVTFAILTLVGVIMTGGIFLATEIVKDNTNKALVSEFSETVLSAAEQGLVEVEVLANASYTSYIQIKKKMPEKAGPNTYTLRGDGSSIVFESQNYGFVKRRQIGISSFEAYGLFFSGNKELTLTFNSSKSNTSIMLS